MPNFLLEPGVAIYMTLGVTLVVWIALFIFLWRVDRQARELRRLLDQQTPTQPATLRATLETRTAPTSSRVVTDE